MLLPDPILLRMYHTPTLLMHGDTLCTDDVQYMAFRAVVRDPAWQANTLAQPLAVRRAQAAALRKQSDQQKQLKSAAIMDVNQQAVADALRQHDYPRLIHGHTHRPARHVHAVDGHLCERWVLPDWHERGGYLRIDATHCEAVPL
jgi:UDP-2,3-diacylglucosamine hydrolase